MKRIPCYILFFLLSYEPIAQEKTGTLATLFKALRKPLPTDYHVVIVQNRWGCHSCNEFVTSFINKKYRSQKHTFIVAFTSEKELQIQFSKIVLESSNVIIDKNNEALRSGLTLENSLIFYLENKVVKKKIILTPENIENELLKSGA